ncbi:Uncharacterized protein OBRU01_02548 [Operophtera brumata]|uniref:Uncharacterized protein n=1 Tax=Operophtera brumata TaxID=104452 RepID=A0A0L7LF69_OPEBR|nr:Uncharacterized protein OBRU01_02548 [Operophtera brumata]
MHEQDGDTEPAHHARRPMNAFLIFCKRHRSVILGEWWANLDKEEKACYTGLAKQLPAPPLRTLSSRPRETTEKLVESPNSETHEIELEKTNNNSTKIDFNKKPNDVALDSEPKTLSMFTPGKLADEAHMGGLSSLLSTKTETQTLNPYYSPPSFKFNAISTPNDYRSQNVNKGAPNEDNIRELQNALTETTKVFEKDFDEKEGVYHYGTVPNDQFTNQDVIDQIVDKRFCKDEDRNWSDEEKNAKSGRSCKGKRYQEFMSVGGLIANKRQKKDFSDKSDDGYIANYSWEPGSSRNEESNSTVSDEPTHISSVIEISTENETKVESMDEPESDNNANKTFKAADFDLDAKIRALPSLSLEKFQQKKRENKRKKKTINPRPRVFESKIINTVPRPIIDERRQMIESWRETVIGSQKRKPRKISITRLEINSMISSVDINNAHKISHEMKLATEAPCSVIQHFGKQTPRNADLLGLATLAEVAANTSKLEDSSIINTFTAKASDEYASKV